MPYSRIARYKLSVQKWLELLFIIGIPDLLKYFYSAEVGLRVADAGTTATPPP